MKQNIQEIRENSSKWFTRYLYEKSQESRTYYNQWPKFNDDQQYLKNCVDFTGRVTGWSRYKREKLVENNKQFLNRLHCSVFTRKNRKLQRWIVIEWGDEGFHSHMLIQKPTHLSEIEFKLMILECWKKTKNGKKSSDDSCFGKFEGIREKSHFTQETGEFSLGYGGYTVKQFTNRSDRVDHDNSYWF